MHRADLVEMLANALPAGTVHTAIAAPLSSRTATWAWISFANGSSAEAEIVIAADGIHSELRRYVFASSRPVFPDRSPTEGWCRMSGYRIGRPTAGKCGSAKKALPRLSRARGKAHQLRRIRATDEEMKNPVSPRRTPTFSGRPLRAGSAHPTIARGSSGDVPMGAL